MEKQENANRLQSVDEIKVDIVYFKAFIRTYFEKGCMSRELNFREAWEKRYKAEGKQFAGEAYTKKKQNCIGVRAA